MKTPKQLYDQASAHDAKGEEEQAIVYYEQAYENIGELSLEDQQGLMLGMGSTYRWIGKVDESLRVFDEAISMFPDAGEFVVFKALSLLDHGQDKKAVADLIEFILSDKDRTSLKLYDRALRHQIKMLNKESP